MELYTAAVMIEHPKTKEMVRQGVSIKTQAEGVDQARSKIRALVVEKSLPSIRAINIASRQTRHFIVYCAPVAQTKPTPGVDTRWRKPPS